MWRVNNSTPYGAAGAWGRDKNGVHEWIVAVRGTFDVHADGSVTPAEVQAPPLLAAEYSWEDGLSSLRYDADLVAPKPTTDVVLNATAYAPGGEPAEEFYVAFRLGGITKQLRVVGNRRWERGLLGLRRSAPEPVARVPIVYERSFGGSDLSDPDPRRQKMDPRNPVGCGVVTREGEPLPNFEPPAGRLARSGPAGFGAVASYWSPRLELNGTYDDAWHATRYPLLPEDWDPRSLQCAPVDQRADAPLRGGELVELENLTPGGLLRFELPNVQMRFRTHVDGVTEEHRGMLATVIVEPDHPRVVMVWHTSLLVPTNVDYLEETYVSVKPRLR